MWGCRRDREDREREIREAEEREALKNMTEAERRAWEAAHPKVCLTTQRNQSYCHASLGPAFKQLAHELRSSLYRLLRLLVPYALTPASGLMVAISGSGTAFPSSERSYVRKPIKVGMGA